MKKLLALAWLALPLNAVPVYFLATGQTGAQTQIDINHTSSWLLTPTVDFILDNGLFTMKVGSNTTADIWMTVYLGNSASGQMLSAAGQSASYFCSFVSNCGQFGTHPFLSGVYLAAGHTYFVTLTSTAPDVQSQAYFIKNDTYFISDSNGTPIDQQPAVFDGAPLVGASPTPEPGSAAMLAGALALWHWREKRSRSR